MKILQVQVLSEAPILRRYRITVSTTGFHLVNRSSILRSGTNLRSVGVTVR